MRNSCAGLNSSSEPSSTRPGSVRQVNGVEVGIIAKVGNGVGELVGRGEGVEVGITGVEGVQAVSVARSVSSNAIRFV